MGINFLSQYKQDDHTREQTGGSLKAGFHYA